MRGGGKGGGNCGCLGGPEGRISTPHTRCARAVSGAHPGQKLGSEYLLTYKTLHCVHGIPLVSVQHPSTV